MPSHLAFMAAPTHWQHPRLRTRSAVRLCDCMGQDHPSPLGPTHMTPFVGLSPPYSTIVADPPWHYDERIIEYGRGETRSAPMPYSTMSVEQIAALPIIDLAAADAHLYLWTTQRYLWDARDIILGWGFAPATVLVWCKPPSGLTP